MSIDNAIVLKKLQGCLIVEGLMGSDTVRGLIGNDRGRWCTNNFLFISANYIEHQGLLLSRRLSSFFVPRAAAIAEQLRIPCPLLLPKIFPPVLDKKQGEVYISTNQE